MKFKYICFFAFLSFTQLAYSYNTATIYVNNILGNDRYDGKSATPNASTGPVKTIQKALDLVPISGRVEIINTGKPYLSGNKLRKGGTLEKPLIIEGNGAVISGLGIVHENEWTNIEGNIYKRPFWPMSNQLKSSKEYNTWIGIPEIWRVNERPAKNCTSKEELINTPGGFWWNKEEKAVWFNLPKDKKFSDLTIELPLPRGNGSGMNVSGDFGHIIIKNLRSEFAFNDGFSAHLSVKNLVFKNCIAVNNCGQGFSMHDKTQVEIEDSFASRNASSGSCDVGSAEVSYKRTVFVNNSFEAGIYTTENVNAKYEDCIIVNNRPFEQIWQIGKSNIYLKNCLVVGATDNLSLAAINNGTIKIESCTFSNGASIARFSNTRNGSISIEKSLFSDLKEIVATKNIAQISFKNSITDISNSSFKDSELTNTKISQKNNFAYHRKFGAQLPASVWKLYNTYNK